MSNASRDIAKIMATRQDAVRFRTNIAATVYAALLISDGGTGEYSATMEQVQEITTDLIIWSADNLTVGE